MMERETDNQIPPIVFVTGKGGVGKSTVAASLALREAQRGRNVLLAELGDVSFFEQWFNFSVDHLPKPIHELHPQLSVCRWEAQTCLKEYLLHYLRVESLVNLFFENKVMKSLVQAAPALREIALLGKITSGLRKIGPVLNYDVIVVDCFATGHFEALMQAPMGLAKAVQFGPMGEQSRAIHNVITDPSKTRFVVVSLPEELPVIETLELCGFLNKDLQVQPRVVLNRVLALPPAAPGTTPFLAYVQSTRERQARSDEQLKDLRPTSLAYSFALDPLERLRALASALEAV
jgi:anion-transporting  ArsA/GET3 family ATPase